MLATKLLSPPEREVLRGTRLTALQDSPDAFLADYDKEKEFGDREWRATEFDRGDWYVGLTEASPGTAPVSLLGITREPTTPGHECFLEYLWVAPEHRRRGVASEMINQVLERLKRSGIRTVFLWVLDGNDRAVRLYERLGFVRCNVRQPLPDRPERSEELMRLNLG